MNCHSLPHRPGIAHRCPICSRLLCRQLDSFLHVKRKDFEGHIVGRATLRCRCGAVTVVETIAKPA